MSSTELTARLDATLVDHLRTAASQAGIPVDDYLARVLSADRDALHGASDGQLARARALTAVAYRTWTVAGRPEDGHSTADEVFGP